MKNLLLKLDACNAAIEWAGNKSWEEIYNTCERGDWLLWLFRRTNPDDLQRLTLAKGHCANTVRHLMKDKRSIDAVDVSISFGMGNCTLKELTEARIAAYADAADAAAAYAADAYAADADAAADAADAADADAAAAAAAAAYAADAYADAAADAAAAAAAADAADADAAAAAAYADARKKNRQETADICRKYLPIEIWNINK